MPALPLVVIQMLSLLEILEWRADHTPDHPLFTVINAKVTAAMATLSTGCHCVPSFQFIVTERVTCKQLLLKCSRVASLLKDKIKTPTVGLVVAIYLNNRNVLLHLAAMPHRISYRSSRIDLCHLRVLLSRHCPSRAVHVSSRHALVTVPSR